MAAYYCGTSWTNRDIVYGPDMTVYDGYSTINTAPIFNLPMPDFSGYLTNLSQILTASALQNYLSISLKNIISQKGPKITNSDIEEIITEQIRSLMPVAIDYKIKVQSDPKDPTLLNISCVFPSTYLQASRDLSCCKCHENNEKLLKG